MWFGEPHPFPVRDLPDWARRDNKGYEVRSCRMFTSEKWHLKIEGNKRLSILNQLQENK